MRYLSEGGGYRNIPSEVENPPFLLTVVCLALASSQAADKSDKGKELERDDEFS